MRILKGFMIGLLGSASFYSMSFALDVNMMDEMPSSYNYGSHGNGHRVAKKSVAKRAYVAPKTAKKAVSSAISHGSAGAAYSAESYASSANSQPQWQDNGASESHTASQMNNAGSQSNSAAQYQSAPQYQQSPQYQYQGQQQYQQAPQDMGANSSMRSYSQGGGPVMVQGAPMVNYGQPQPTYVAPNYQTQTYVQAPAPQGQYGAQTGYSQVQSGANYGAPVAAAAGAVAGYGVARAVANNNDGGHGNGGSYGGEYQSKKSSSPWGFAVLAGTEVFGKGNFVKAADSAVFDGALFNAALAGNSRMFLKGRNFGDMYKPAMRTAIEVRHAAGEFGEMFANISYLKAQGKTNVAMGCFEVQTAVGTCAYDITGSASDLVQKGVEIGYRQWFPSSVGGFNPYYAVHGGIIHTDAIHLNLAAGANGLYNCCYYKASNSYTVGGEVGVSKRIGTNAEIAAEVGLRYVSKLSGATSTNFDVAGLSSINDDSSYISMPVNLRFQSSF